MAMPKKPKQQIASTSRKISESLFFRVEVGTIARIDDVLERFEDHARICCERPSNARLSGANVNSANK